MNCGYQVNLAAIYTVDNTNGYNKMCCYYVLLIKTAVSKGRADFNHHIQ